MTTTATKTKTKRGTIRQLLNRTTIYNLSDYARKVSKATGREYSNEDIVRSLEGMQREGRIWYVIAGHNGRNVIGGLNVRR